MKVVVTGKVAGESRQTAEAKLRSAGYDVQSAVTAETDVLVTGERVGATKTNKAAGLGVSVMPWEEFWRFDQASTETDELAAKGGAATAVAAPTSVRMVAPMLAKKAELPVGEDWLFEVKFDGWRCVATIVDGAVAMQSRSGKTDLTTTYPHIVEVLSEFPNCVIDGELVSFDEDGQEIGLSNGHPTLYVVWDLLSLDGTDVRRQPLTGRRWLLQESPQLKDAWGGLVQVSPTFDDGQQLLDWAAGKGREGVVAKRRSGPYVEGHRGWIKVKCRNEQEFVIVGWTPGKGSNAGRPGGVLLAYWQDGKLMYAGRCGVAYEGDEPISKLTTRPTSPLGEKIKPPPDTTWVEPELVVQVLFQNWTPDGRLWHPIWKHLRYDKPMEEVTRDA